VKPIENIRHRLDSDHLVHLGEALAPIHEETAYGTVWVAEHELNRVRLLPSHGANVIAAAEIARAA
jgi:hypothetical protein